MSNPPGYTYGSPELAAVLTVILWSQPYSDLW